jgi:hypothetical protein
MGTPLLSDCCSKGVPGNVEGQMLGDMAHISNFFEVLIHLLGAQNRQNFILFTAYWMVNIPFQNLLRQWQ